MKLLLPLVFLLLSGCATIYPECKKFTEGSQNYITCQAEEAEEARNDFWYDYAICRALYKKSNVSWWSSSYSHPRRGLKIQEARADYGFNRCHPIVRQACKRNTEFPLC